VHLSTSFGSPWRFKDVKDAKTWCLPGGMYLSPRRRWASFEDVSRLRQDPCTSLGDASLSFGPSFSVFAITSMSGKVDIFERSITHNSVYHIQDTYRHSVCTMKWAVTAWGCESEKDIRVECWRAGVRCKWWAQYTPFEYVDPLQYLYASPSALAPTENVLNGRIHPTYNPSSTYHTHTKFCDQLALENWQAWRVSITWRHWLLTERLVE